MVQVNPPPQIKLPPQFEKDPQVATYFRLLDRMLFQMWKRLGGGNDFVSDALNDETSGGLIDSDIEEMIQDDLGLEVYDRVVDIPVFNGITKSTNYTMLSYDFVNAKSNATITFPEFPDENDLIIIRNGDGTIIKLNGNGRNMNGSSTGQIVREGTAITFQYFIDTNEWFAR